MEMGAIHSCTKSENKLHCLLAFSTYIDSAPSGRNFFSHFLCGVEPIKIWFTLICEVGIYINFKICAFLADLGIQGS